MAISNSLSLGQTHSQTQSQGQRQQWSTTVIIRTATKLGMSQWAYSDHLNETLGNNPAAEIEEYDGADAINSIDDITADREMFESVGINSDYYQQVFDALNSETCIGRPVRSTLGSSGGEDVERQSQHAVEQTFSDRLLELVMVEDGNLRAALEFLIFSLDERGFLTRSLGDLAYNFVEQLYEDYDYASSEDQDRMFDESLRLLEVARRTLLTFEPKGVGTSSVSECLLLQLKSHPQDEVTELAEAIVLNHYDRFVRLGGKYDSTEGQRFAKDIVKKYNATPTDFIDALSEIRSCNPLPSAGFSSQVVVQMPEFFVKVLDDNRIMVVQNFGYLPKFRRSSDASSMLKQSRGEKDEEFHKNFQENLKQVDAEIQDYRMRNTALMHMMLGIVKMQRKFFITGDKKDIVPCTRHDLHDFINATSNAEEKVISYYAVARAVKDRYFAMDGGIYPLSMFFSATIPSASGGNKSKAYVRERIKELVNTDEGKLLSDQKITDLLNQEGLKIARRTVAKYRQEMKIEKNYHSEKRVKRSPKTKKQIVNY